MAVDPVLIAIVAFMLAFVFGAYLFFRRIATGFREGMEEARRER